MGITNYLLTGMILQVEQCVCLSSSPPGADQALSLLVDLLTILTVVDVCLQAMGTLVPPGGNPTQTADEVFQWLFFDQKRVETLGKWTFLTLIHGALDLEDFSFCDF